MDPDIEDQAIADATTAMAVALNQRPLLLRFERADGGIAESPASFRLCIEFIGLVTGDVRG